MPFIHHMTTIYQQLSDQLKATGLDPQKNSFLFNHLNILDSIQSNRPVMKGVWILTRALGLCDMATQSYMEQAYFFPTFPSNVMDMVVDDEIHSLNHVLQSPYDRDSENPVLIPSLNADDLNKSLDWDAFIQRMEQEQHQYPLFTNIIRYWKNNESPSESLFALNLHQKENAPSLFLIDAHVHMEALLYKDPVFESPNLPFDMDDFEIERPAHYDWVLEQRPSLYQDMQRFLTLALDHLIHQWHLDPPLIQDLYSYETSPFIVVRDWGSDTEAHCFRPDSIEHMNRALEAREIQSTLNQTVDEAASGSRTMKPKSFL